MLTDSNKNTLLIYAQSEDEFISSAVSDILQTILSSVKKRGICRLGLAGGNTPKSVYKTLGELTKFAGEKIPWENLEIISIDERFVPSDHNESNQKMIRESLLANPPLFNTKTLFFETDLGLVSAIKEMNRQLSSRFLELQETNHGDFLFDLLILGMGTDGHLASLFEGDPSLDSLAFSSKSTAKNHLISSRLTLTLTALKRSRRGLVLLHGANKASLLEAIIKPDQSKLQLSAFKAISLQMPLKILAYL